MEKYRILKSVGDGTYGCVLQALNSETGELVAIKRMKKEFRDWDVCVELAEVQSLKRLSHPNIVQLKEIIRENNKELYFVFEFLQMNLYQLIKDRTKFLAETTVRNCMYQMLMGVGYMHSAGYFHRDLKPENMLVTEDGVLKVADLGLAREIKSKPPYTDYVSTRWYRAPEVLLRSARYSAPIDLWALGAMMAELYTFRPLFPGSSEPDEINKICQVMGTPTNANWPQGLKLAREMKFQFPTYAPVPLRKLVPNASPEAIHLMTQLLHYDPARRPTCAEALSHPFFQVGRGIPPNLGAFPVSVHRAIDARAEVDDNKGLGMTLRLASSMPGSSELGESPMDNVKQQQQQRRAPVVDVRGSRYTPGVEPRRLAQRKRRTQELGAQGNLTASSKGGGEEDLAG
jgi:protein kinase